MATEAQIKILQEYQGQIYDHFAGTKLTEASIKPKDTTRNAELNMLRARLGRAKVADDISGLSESELKECETAIENLKGVLKDGAVVKILGGSEPLPKPEKDTPELPKPPPVLPKVPPKVEPQKPDPTRTADVSDQDWAKNVRRFSSTSSTYSWDARYIDGLINEFKSGSPSLAMAHTRTAVNLRNNPVNISGFESYLINQKELSNYSSEEKKFFKPIQPGTYQEVPFNSHPATDTGWLANKKGNEVVIFIGATKKSEENSRFREQAEQLKATLESTNEAVVRIVATPSKKAMEDHIKALGERSKQGNKEQVMVVFIGHGGASVESTTGVRVKDWAKLAKGSFWSRDSQSRGGQVFIEETEFRGWVNKYLAPNCDNVNIVWGSCHSGSWVS